MFNENETQEYNSINSNTQLNYIDDESDTLNSINKELLKNYINNTEYINKIINNDEDLDSMHYLITESEKEERYAINLISMQDMNIIIDLEDKLSNLKLIPSENARQHKNIIIYDNRNQVFKYYFFNLVRTVFSLAIFY
jgi:hypothetical protein